MLLKKKNFCETNLNMLKQINKTFLSSGSAFTKCDTDVTLKLLTSISSEFLLCNKKKFLSKLRIFSFISEKKILIFLDIYLSSY